eukprot:545261-Pelagomonas_calceolata.AAC.1
MHHSLNACTGIRLINAFYRQKHGEATTDIFLWTHNFFKHYLASKTGLSDRCSKGCVETHPAIGTYPHEHQLTRCTFPDTMGRPLRELCMACILRREGEGVRTPTQLR